MRKLMQSPRTCYAAGLPGSLVKALTNSIASPKEVAYTKPVVVLLKPGGLTNTGLLLTADFGGG